MSKYREFGLQVEIQQTDDEGGIWLESAIIHISEREVKEMLDHFGIHYAVEADDGSSTTEE